jgi:DNA-binding NarL/FixJ family response regulator
MTVRVLLADDQRLVRGGFRMILGSEAGIEVVGEAADGAEAVALTAELRPDVVLMDVRMANIDGIEATRRIVDGSDGAPRVLVLTTFDLDEYVYEALRAGASGFLLKDAPEEQLVAGIRIVAEGGSLFAPRGNTPAHRTVRRRRAGRAADRPSRAHPAGARGAPPPRPWAVERRDCRGARPFGAHGEDPRRPHSRQARPS